MPELPDVETFRRYLDATALHKKITGTSITDKRILDGVSMQKLTRRLKGRELEKTRRHGKYLFVKLKGNGWLVLHFGMTGEFTYYRDTAERPEHARMILHFTNGYRLAYISQRLLGRVGLAEDLESFFGEHDLGPDALSDKVDRERFLRILEGKRGMIKPTLMDQSMISGIGNVYSDEILFQAKIHPKTPVNKLNGEDRKELYRTMRRVLRVASRNQADPGRFPRGYITPRRKQGDKCPACAGEVKKITVSGRSSYYCPLCQHRE
jgi:formamidopyrimidine-DNA glycosylase